MPICTGTGGSSSSAICLFAHVYVYIQCETWVHCRGSSSSAPDPAGVQQGASGFGAPKKPDNGGQLSCIHPYTRICLRTHMRTYKRTIRIALGSARCTAMRTASTKAVLRAAQLNRAPSQAVLSLTLLGLLSNDTSLARTCS